ncbi:MAG TPA: hypothetical protein VFT22_17195 [Kofleriaceae bacterium]|nr:hypothetical protein [Kofleriaceae bacterium]
MTRTVIAPALAAGIALMLGLTGAARGQAVSPGPLSNDHAALEGVDNCIRCHSGGAAISAPSCLSCHRALAQRIAANAGYHAKLGDDCARCHPDHRGVSAALVKWPGGRDAFDHTRAGYPLTGGHAKVACRDCHKVGLLTGSVAAALTAEERPRTYLGLGTACVACHADVHKPTLGTDCERCHDTKTWRGAATSTRFDHGKTRYPLLGAHAKVACARCHGGTDQKLDELHPKFETCQTCHRDPHAGAMGDARACASCHREAAWKELRYDRRTHAPRTLPLAGGHATPTCAACHGDKLDRRPATACASCHPDPHRPSLGARCEPCHQATSWLKGAPPQPTFHERTAYPLRGRHATVACDKCHDPRRPSARRFRPIAHGACLDCHRDPHAGEADGPCERCHAVEGWDPARFEAADHAKTRFALDGAHRAVPCAKCHPPAPGPSGFRRGNPACEVCHADPHDGQFAGKGGCATCHAVAAWSPSTFTRQAHAATGFALTGKHDVACARCHARQFVGVASECSACHDDRHAGQFVPRACTTCHAGAAWKPTPGFDHARTFVLRGRHAQADCARCHPETRLAISPGTTLTTTVYKLGKTARECAGCHRAQHGDPKSGRALPRRLADATRGCAECHGETEWRDVAAAPAFDHAVTGTPLVAGHARAPCGGCHTPRRRTLPRLVECATCHADRHAGRLGDRCESCHSQASWKQDQLLVDHQRTRLPLVGAHAVQGCASCHRDAQAGVYRGLDPTCRGCHLHTVEERRPHPDHTRDLAFNACESCHSPLGWRPAHLDHDRFWALTGKHRATVCEACHTPGQPYRAAPTQCAGCHMTDAITANTKVPGHDQYGTGCGSCHDTASWLGATFNHTWFPIPHRGTSTCATCHLTPDAPSMFTCGLNGACHPQVDTDRRHREVGGYLYDSQQCYRCHPRSRGGD